jgi:hypothetical protein
MEALVLEDLPEGFAPEADLEEGPQCLWRRTILGLKVG